MKEILKTIELASKFKEEIDKMVVTKPYHLNVIDELHINENAHSRILLKLLEYSTNGNYTMLELLLAYIKRAKRAKAFSHIKVVNPIMTHNEQFIDLWVRDDDYAIIFENKVYDAKDEEKQLSRYIDATRNCGRNYDLSQIYVVYLSSRDGHGPDTQTWGPYKEEFEPRYVNLSFREDIRTWLRYYVLPHICLRDISAVEQYLDYLDGLFLQRESDKTMNKEAKQILDLMLDLNHSMSIEQKLAVIKNQKQGVDSLKMNMDNYVQDLEVEIADRQRKWLKDGILKIMNDYPAIDLERYSGEDAVGSSTKYGRYGGVRLKVDGKNSLLYIALDDKDGWHCQLIADKNIYDLAAREISIVRKFLPEKDSEKDKIWKYYSSIEECYEVFCAVLRAIEK